jgi:prepilin-type processing-associated H-X9-DG protein
VEARGYQPARLSFAFTLVELLVVVGIIAMLIGLLMPVLGQARRQAKMLVEESAARQLSMAYTMYAGENRGWLIPAFYGDTSVQFASIDNTGRPLGDQDSRRWPWRLMPYCKFGLRGTILVNDMDMQLGGNPTQLLWSYGVSLNPSFGLNYQGLGGEVPKGWTLTPGTSWCVRRSNQVTHPTERIVFVGARGPGFIPGVPSEGYFRVVSPLGDPSEVDSPAWSTAAYNPLTDPGQYGYVSPRWTGNRSVVAMYDGHVELLTLDQLRDMRYWSEQAAQTGNANWTP